MFSFLFFFSNFIFLISFDCSILFALVLLLLFIYVLFVVLLVNFDVIFSLDIFLLSWLIIRLGFSFWNNICAFLFCFSSTENVFSTFWKLSELLWFTIKNIFDYKIILFTSLCFFRCFYLYSQILKILWFLTFIILIYFLNF